MKPSVNFIWSHFFSALFGALLGAGIGGVITFHFVSEQTQAHAPNKLDEIQQKNPPFPRIPIFVCRNEIQRFCKDKQRKPKELETCLLKAWNDLSVECQRHLKPN